MKVRFEYVKEREVRERFEGGIEREREERHEGEVQGCGGLGGGREGKEGGALGDTDINKETNMQVLWVSPVYSGLVSVCSTSCPPSRLTPTVSHPPTAFLHLPSQQRNPPPHRFLPLHP